MGVNSGFGLIGQRNVNSEKYGDGSGIEKVIVMSEVGKTRVRGLIDGGSVDDAYYKLGEWTCVNDKGMTMSEGLWWCRRARNRCKKWW